MASYGGLPDFSTFLSNQDAINAATAAPAAPPGPAATGTGNWFTAGLGSGFHGALASVGGFGEALARVGGYDAGADAAARFADSERAAAATYARPDLEASPWSLSGVGYRLAQMAPQAVAGIGGALAGAALAPEEAAAAGMVGLAGVAARAAPGIGGAVGAFPFSAGENVQRSKDYYGELTRGSAAKALALAAPEAALQGIVPGKLEGMLAGKVGDGFVKTVRNTALTQIPVGAATELLTQLMGDPNRPVAERAQDVVSAALQGAVLGGVTAGIVHPVSAAMHALAKTPVQNVTPGGLFDFLNNAFNPVEPVAPVPPVPPVPPMQNFPQPPEGFQRPLPGLENLPNQSAAQAPDAQAQGAFDFQFGQPSQGELPLVGGASQTDMFGRVFPVPGLGYDNGIVAQPTIRGEAPGAPGEQTPLPGLELPEQLVPAPDARGIQDQLPLNLAAEEPEQRGLPLLGGHHQPLLIDAERLGPAGGFDQGALPVQTMAHATPQKSLTLEQAKAQNAANRNHPPSDQPPTSPADLTARLRDPRDPLFKASGGVNDNTAGHGPTREASPQPPLPLAAPGEAPVGNPPTLRGATAQPPVKGPLTTQESLRKAGLSPVQVGKEVANAPANRNVEGPGATREASPQGDVLTKPGEIAPANDKFDQSTYQKDLNKVPEFRGKTFKTQTEAEDAVAKSVTARDEADKPVPPALIRVAEGLGIMKDGELVGRHAAGATAPEGPHETLDAGVQEPEVPKRENIPGAGGKARYDRLAEIRAKLGDNLNDPETFGLVRRTADLQNELQDVKGSNRTGQIAGEINKLAGEVEKRNAPAAPQPSDPKALASSTAPTPDAQAFIAARQGAPTTSEAKARARKAGKAPEAPREPVKTLPEIIPAVNPLEAAQDAEAMSRMTNEGGPAPAEREAPPQTQEAARKAARTKAKAKATEPAPQEPQTQEAARKATKTNVKAKATEPAPPVPPEPDARYTNRTQEGSRPMLANMSNEELRAAYERMQDDPKERKFYGVEIFDRQTDGRMPKPGVDFEQRLAAKSAEAKIDSAAQAEDIQRQKQESQTTQAVEAEIKKPTRKTPLTREIAGILAMLRQSLETLRSYKPDLTKGAMAARVAFNKNIEAHDKQLAVIEKAAREGGLEALQNFRRNHFDDNLWTDATGRLTPAGETALVVHSTHEAYLMDQIAALRGERPLVRYSTQPTVHDVNLASTINATGKLSDALEFIRQKDPSSMNRLMASILSKLGMDTSIRMASDEHLLEDTTRKLGEGQIIAASHNDQLNRISVYDGSNVARSVLHEAFHAATVRALAAGSRAASGLRDLFSVLSKRAGSAGFYGMTNAEEMVAEGGSNPIFQQWLKSEPIAIRGVGDLWTAFKNAMFKTLGMPEHVRTAFDQVMDGTQKLMAENPTQAAVTGDRPLLVERGVKAFVKGVDTIGHAGLSRLAREGADGVSRMTQAGRSLVLGWTGGLDIAEVNRKEMPTQVRYVEAGIKTEDRVDTMFKTAAAAMHKLDDGVSQKGKELIDKVAARSLQQLDVTRKFEDHTHLKGHPKSDILKEQHAQGVNDMNALRRIDGGKALKAFEAMRDEYANKYTANNVHKLWDYVRNNQPDLIGKVKGFESDPFDQYDHAYTAHDDPKVALQFMRDKEAALHQGLKAVHSDLLKDRDKLAVQVKADDKLRASKDKAVRDTAMTPVGRKELDAGYKEAKAQFNDLDGLLKEIDAGNERQKQAPYAHIGREGAHFVAADLATDDSGIIKESAIDALGKMLNTKGFKDVAVMKGLTSNKFYVRLGSETERREMVEELQKLNGHVVENSISRGLADNEGIFNSLSSSRMREIVEAAKANKPDYPEGASDSQKIAIDNAHKQNIRELMRSLVETLPKSSLERLYQRREGVQGFNSNMVRNFRAASDSNSRGLANLTMAAESGQRMREMRDEMKRLQGDTKVPEGRLTALQQSYNELLARSQGVSTYSTTEALDAFRKLGHIISVGLSPTYVMTLGAQAATLTFPQLGSVHGFVRSAQTLAGVASDTFKMVSAVAHGPDGSTFGVRHSVLTDAKLSAKDVEFHMDMARRGMYTKGFTEAMTGHDTSTGVNKAMHYTNVLGRYSEMAPRVQAALAARKLYMEDAAKFNAIKAKNPNAEPSRVLKEFATAEDYAAHVVTESQLDWHQQNTARQQTRGGTFGVMSPIINQFMGFQTRMSAKLYREVHGALGGDAQSQKWLLGHAAAVAVISGTLGLPMVSVAASVYDRLADWVTGKDDHDVIASYRNYLASAFGKEVGEVIARGAPRALGVNFDHAGEGKILPGSTTLMMLTEKRKLEDAERDWLKSEGGHAVGLMFDLALAARDISNGDYLDGSLKLVPELLKGPMEAYRLSERNFVDKTGQRLPISATATDVMMTAMGIEPAKEAEYYEEQKVGTGLNAMRQARSQNITRHLLLAQSRGDGQMFQDWERQAVQFQLDHPGMMGPLQDFGRTLSAHIRAASLARGFGTPLGVKQRDVVGRSMASFGNLREQ